MLDPNLLSGGIMRSQSRHFLFCASIFVSILALAATVRAQEAPKPPSSQATITKPQLSAAKKPAAPAANEAELGRTPTEAGKDSAEQISKRAEWFYKQRSSVKGHIPGGAHFKAFQHMQRMMLAEGKLVLRPDGTYAEVAPQSWLQPLGAVTSTWASIGPTPTTGGFFSPVTGRVTTIAVDPSDSTGNTVLLGGAMGGIWRSTDAGTTWTAVGDQNASLAMGSIAFAPSNHSVVYAGTGESESVAFDIYYGAGVLKSMDGGKTWAQTCTVASSTCPFIGPYDDITPFGFFTLGGTRITYIAVNPTNPQMVLVGAQTQFSQGPTEGVYCTDNGGTTWSNILPDQLSSFVGFASSSVAYAALGNPFRSAPNAPNGNGIYKATGINSTSTCATLQFARLTAPTLPPQSSMGRIDLGISPNFASDNTIYASIADGTVASTSNLGVFVTTDGGTTWTQTPAPDVCQFQCWYDNVVKVDPNNKNVAFFAGSSVADPSGNPGWVTRTENGGTTWSSVIPNLPGGSSGLPHVDNHALSFVKLPTGKVRLYLGNDGGIWRTDDAEASSVAWTNLNNPSLTLTQFYPSISINASSPSFAFGGTQDNGSQNYQGGISWLDNQQCGDGASAAVDPVIPSTVYIGCATGFPVNASYQNGAIGTFSPAVNGINPNDFSSFIPPLIADPGSANTVYFGTTKVYQSVDAGNTWIPISNDLVFNGDSLTVLAVAPTNSSVMYVGANAGASVGALTGLVFVSTNVSPGNFASFFQVSGQGSLPPRALTAIAIDPSDNTGKTAYVTFSGFSFVNASFGVNDPTGHIFKTTDGGNTWKDVGCSVAVCTTPAASDLPNIPVNDVVVDPDIPGTIYAGTDLGVFVGNCATAPCTWTTLSTGLPRVVVHSLRLHEPSRTLRAATHGRGAWDINLNNFAFSGPHISSITPISVNVGGAQFTLTANGSGLANGAVQWNGSVTGVTTTQVSDTKLTASISASLLATAGTPKITVANGTQTSNALTFSVLAATPTLTSITPPSTPVQSPFAAAPVQIQLTGTNFAANAKVLFNGAQNGISVAAPTTSCPLPTCLMATLPAILFVGFGSTNSISVLNLPPGGGQSKPANFQVVAPPPPNDNFANAINITTVSYADTQDTSGATTESADPTPPCAHQYTPSQGNTGGHPNGVYNTIWYKFTPQFSANLNVDTITISPSYDTVLSIWTGSPTSGFVNVACNDDINPGIIIQSQLTNVPLTAGTTYYIMVSSFGPPDPNPIALGGRSQLNFSYNGGFNPAPTLISVSPSSANSGDPGVTLTINGSGFLSGAFAQFTSGFSGYTTTQTITTNLKTTYLSTTQLTAILPASAIALPTNGQITVSNPLPQYGGANSLAFTVNVGTYPIPTLNSTYPTSVLAGTVAFGISANGGNFASTAVLNVNGVPQPTTVQSSQNLSANVSQADIATAGTAQVTVTNPTPGGGVSSPQPLTILQPTVVPTISSVSPSSGPANSSISLNITGTGFLSGAVLNFSGINYITNVSSSTQLTGTIQSPVGTGSYALYVVDPAPAGTSAAFMFTVTGPPDFSIASSGSAQTVTAGQTATFTNAISVAAQNGFSAQVNLSCALPFNATATTCAVNPNMFATGSGTATVTVTTMARGFMPPAWPRLRFISRPQFLPVLLLTILLSILFLRFARTRRQRLVGVFPLVVLAFFLILQATGCGGGSSGPPPPTGTPAGIYTVTVTGTSGGTTHTTTLKLTVN